MITMRNDMKLDREVAGKKQPESVSARMLCDSIVWSAQPAMSYVGL
jgi:hypothetical protein